ncbi:MAG TPA: DnaJ family domain-containing protein [Ktedonobacteraceae bacterium]|nr:DnaJ family domain-containing protein [Ktedonobacteraceae bacterium]
MDFKDWRGVARNVDDVEQERRANRLKSKHFQHYVEEQIQEAVARGEFDNLPGTGKPLNLDDDVTAGDKTSAYRLLKQNGYAPPEIELLKEIRSENERVEQQLNRLRIQARDLRTRRVPPFPSEKRAYNDAVKKASAAYEEKLRALNRKILTFNLSVPASMHMSFLEVEKKVQQFHAACPLLPE